MADMANKPQKNSFVYGRLSFLAYDCPCPLWTPSGSCPLCFDASLLSTSKAAGNGGSFFDPRSPLRQHKFGRHQNSKPRPSICPGGSLNNDARPVASRAGRALETINALAAGLMPSTAQ